MSKSKKKNNDTSCPPGCVSELRNDMNTDAIKTLIIGCRLAQKSGAYTFEEARTIIDAIDFLNIDK